MESNNPPLPAGTDRADLCDPAAAHSALLPFFRPRSVAVVGASRSPAGIGHRLLDAILRGGFTGSVYPVNPHAAAIGGVRAYPTVRDLPEPIDLAVIAVPADSVTDVVDDCAAAGVRAVVVITAGFAEAGGRALQQQLVDQVHRHGMRLIGPNCLGLVANDPAIRLNATFIPFTAPPGCVSMSSDSGALGLAALAALAREGPGVCSFVSVGNRADVSSNDLLEYWENDDNTEVILLYLESFGNPRRFARVARRVSRRKPIVVVKAGRTKAGSRAAGSHTAALAVPDLTVDGLFHQTGVIRAESLEEIFELAAALASQPLPRGRRLAIVTNAGGPAILCVDAAESAGLSVVQFSDKTRSQLAAFLPKAASIGNPVDMIASATPEEFARASRIALESGEIDALIVIYIAAGVASVESVSHAVQESVAAARSPGASEKPVLLCLMPEQVELRTIGSGKVRIPCYPYPESAARVLGKMAAYSEWRSRPSGKTPTYPDIDFASARGICAIAGQRPGGWLSAEENRLLLKAACLPLVAGGFATNADRAVALARAVGYPVAVKLASQTVVHKTEAGGVRLNLSDEASVRRAFEEMQRRFNDGAGRSAMEGVLVQRMVPEGTEVMVGVTRDALFGPLVGFGLGGIHVEIPGDVCFRVTPLTDRDAAEMVRGIRGCRLFEGYRGHAPADVAALEDVLLRVSALVEAIPEIAEMDLNPLFALPPGQGCRIVDVRIRVAEETRTSRPGAM